MSKRKKIVTVISTIAICSCCILATTKLDDNIKKDEIYNKDMNDEEIVEQDDSLIPLGSNMHLIQPNEYDVEIIPDEYNTGCQEDSLIYIETDGTYDGIYYKHVSNGQKLCLDFACSNKEINGTVTITNYDFTRVPLVFYNEGMLNRNIDVVFENCMFSLVQTGVSDALINYTFNNCTFNRFYGSNSTFNNCKFGKSFNDCIIPFRNVSLFNCYFRDLNYSLEGGSVHSDGVQIYGKESVNAENIYFYNCRFEVPAIQNADSSASVNACLMVQLEYSNGSNIKFKNCRINGGGYSIYARALEPYQLNDVTFENISVGGAKLFKTLYSDYSENVEFNNVYDTDSLYVGSVWRDENGNTHISASNDTLKERTLRVYTSNGGYSDYKINPCIGGNDLWHYEGQLSYSDFPFDLDIVLNEICDWLVCYDITNGEKKQIRAINWGDGVMAIEENDDLKTDTNIDGTATSNKLNIEYNKIYDCIESNGDMVIEGICGDSISFSLDALGNLVLQGTGETYNYHSNFNSPWYEYRDRIVSIEVGSGIITLGTQIFRECKNLIKVTLPDSLININSNAFIKCSSLSEVTLPKNLLAIGNYAFAGLKSLETVYCDSNQWSRLSIGKNNEILTSKVQLIQMEDSTEVTIITSGQCGNNVSYSLSSTGILELSGYGDTFNYSSNNTAPWYEYKDTIVEVKIAEGITRLGNQLLRGCGGLYSIELPDSITEIGSNTFIACISLNEIHIPNSLQIIGKYAFSTTKLQKVYYSGSEEEWMNITIEDYNLPLSQANIIY